MCPPGDSAASERLLSLLAILRWTRRAPGGQHVAALLPERPLTTTFAGGLVEAPSAAARQLATTLPCDASKNLLGTSTLAFAKNRAKMAGGPASSTYFYSDLLAGRRLESMESHLGMLAVAKIVEEHGLTSEWGIAVMLW